MLKKIISGGQTGADRAALDVAIEYRIPHGGWYPRGRLSEDGPLSDQYALQETPSVDYRQRTEWNVRGSDGTLIITRGHPTGGTTFTITLVARYNKPCLVIDVTQEGVQCTTKRIVDWLKVNNITVLNVAGPRASKIPEIYHDVWILLSETMKTLFIDPPTR